MWTEGLEAWQPLKTCHELYESIVFSGVKLVNTCLNLFAGLMQLSATMVSLMTTHHSDSLLLASIVKHRPMDAKTALKG